MTRGCFQIAFGEKYVEEAKRSIASLRASSPGIKIAVVSDVEWSGLGAPDFFIKKPPYFSLEAQPAYMALAPFDENLYLDTDTVVVQDLSGVFGLLELYDVAVFSDGPMLRGGDEFHFVPQCNGGVILFRKSAQVEAVLREWHVKYINEKNRLIESLPATLPKGPRNQKILTRLLAGSRELRVGQLPAGLNFTLWRTMKVYNSPLIYHGRVPTIEHIHHRLMKRWLDGNDTRERIWLPHVSGFLPALGVLPRDIVFSGWAWFRRQFNRIRDRRVNGL